ncbi:hypothetical protein [Amycolatopsis pigmentata]|uniref:AAA+ ATPase domain-containing protein n=1 Tax=Amycolatopsis pigmentata TaxID=450801 RepID=A0ABW5FP60_9PSEU
MTLGRHKHINQALMRIARRAESTDRTTLATTYVTAGSLSAVLNSTDHQILYGRRGTGKTHALLYLSDLVECAGDVVVYLDLRTIGSAGGPSPDRADRGTQLLVDTLEAIHEELLAVALEQEITSPERLLRALDALADAATGVEVVGEIERETTLGGSAEVNDTAGLSLSARPTVSVSSTTRRSATRQNRVRKTGIERNRVLFGPLTRALRAITDAISPARLWLLLDEWSSIPLELQPLLADLLRRGVLPVAGITVKIAAIERRTRFALPTQDGDYLGLEVGADAASAVNLDDVLIFDHARHRVEEFFGQLFFNHANAKLATMIPDPPADPPSLITETFRGTAFTELVRAAEGVPRDAINIAALAAQHAHDDSIDIADIRRAARDWYLRDKQAAINNNEPARHTLQLLIDEVVGRRRSRTFVLDQATSIGHDIINTLYDARLLHIVRRGITDPQHPGRLYDGFAVDYGCYVALLLDGQPRNRPRDRNRWLTSPKSIPPEDFNLAKTAINLGLFQDPLWPDTPG